MATPLEQSALTAGSLAVSTGDPTLDSMMLSGAGAGVGVGGIGDGTAGVSIADITNLAGTIDGSTSDTGSSTAGAGMAGGTGGAGMVPTTDAILEVQQHLLPQLQLMRSTGLMCDITLSYGIGASQRIYKAHKAVLVAVSQTFHMLAQDGSLAEHAVYEIQGAVTESSAEALENLLDFMYSGILRVNTDTMWLLHKLSDALRINEACQLCEAFICEAMGVDIESNVGQPINIHMSSAQRTQLSRAIHEVRVVPVVKREPRPVAGGGGGGGDSNGTAAAGASPMEAGGDGDSANGNVKKPRRSSRKSKRKMPLDASDIGASSKKIKREPGTSATAGDSDDANRSTPGGTQEGGDGGAAVLSVVHTNTQPQPQPASRRYSLGRIKHRIGNQLRYGRRFQTLQIKSGKDFRTGRFPLPYDKPCPVCGQKFQFHSTLALHRRVCRHPRAIDRSAVTSSGIGSASRHIPVIRMDPLIAAALVGDTSGGVMVQQMYRCTLCTATFQLLTQCQSHINTKHDLWSKTCHVCRETFNSRTALRVHRVRMHRKTIPSERVYTCFICPRFFRHQRSVFKHIVLNHRGSKDTTLAACPTCPQVFNSGSALYRHIVERHRVLPEKYGVYDSPVTVVEGDALDQTNKLAAAMASGALSIDQLGLGLGVNNVMLTAAQHTSGDALLGNAAAGAGSAAAAAVTAAGTQQQQQQVATSDGFTCEYCMQPFTTEETLLRHLGMIKVCDLFIATEKNGWNTITCLICGMDHANDQDLKVHMRAHRNHKSLMCVECNHMYKCRTLLCNHVMENHNLHEQLKAIAQTLECSLEALTLLKWGELETLHQKYGENCMKCSHCTEAFNKPKALALHCHEKHGMPGCMDLPRIEDSFYPSTGVWHVCEVKGCSATFRKLDMMRRHMRSKHPKVLYKCNEPKCKFKTQVKTELSRHWNLEHGHLQNKKDLVCTICNKRFKKNWNIRVHMAGKHKIIDPKLTQYQCNQPSCQFVAYTKTALNVHMAGSHLNLRPHDCQYCKKAFKQKGALNMHLSLCKMNPDREERNKENHTCDICGRNLSSAYTLYVHQRSVHKNDKDYSCDMCSFKTNHQWGLSHHMLKIHKIIPPNRKIYRCDLCDYVCIKPNLIKEHKLRHEGKPSLQCPHCDKLCYTQPELNSHVKATHSLVKYECEFCNQLLRNVSDLERHVILQHTHRGLKPWKCPHCDYRSGLKGNIQLHCKKQHREKVCTAVQEFPMPKVKLNLRKVRITREEMQKCRKRRDIPKLPTQMQQQQQHQPTIITDTAIQPAMVELASGGSRTVQLPMAAGTTILNANGQMVDVGTTLELMPDNAGGYRLANPQQLQQIQHIVVSRGGGTQTLAAGATITTAGAVTAGHAQQQAATAVFPDQILTIPAALSGTNAAAAAGAVAAQGDNIQHLLLQQPITATALQTATGATVVQQQQQQHQQATVLPANSITVAQVPNQTLVATQVSQGNVTTLQQLQQSQQQQQQQVQQQQVQQQQNQQQTYMSSTNQVMQYLSDASQTANCVQQDNSNTTRLYYQY